LSCGFREVKLAARSSKLKAPMVVFPPCKINLGLHIVAKRSDGYHDLITCFYPIPWNDILEIIPAAEFSFTHSGISIPGTISDNLCVRAYRLLQKDFNIRPVAIHLHKIIPLGAGLGGGSSDAAWTLKILNSIFKINLSQARLHSYAAELGSDCAFFIHDKPMIGKGRGEILSDTSVSLRNKFIVLVKPDVHVSTAEAFAGVKPKTSEVDLSYVLENYSAEEWSSFVKNDFDDSVFVEFPVIAKIKDDLYEAGALYASMSGSGSAVFGIFSKPVDLTGKFPGMIYWSGTI
jgi:4-diphosphocytidyl-2-C-methyl-D-erythritol kinase